jgi:glycerate 2-kinase
MRVVICPDKFAGTLSAVDAARAIARGWRSIAPGDELVLRPVSDGGPGFVDVLHTSIGGELLDVPTTDPLGRPVTGHILVVGEASEAGPIVYVESADATGLHHLAAHERDPKVTSSRGLAALVVAAVRAGARRVVIGLGGSATNDGGAGFLAGLGRYPAHPAGVAVPDGGAWLAEAEVLGRAAGGPPIEELGGVEVVAASDVDNPLTGAHGASAVYGPQKGATPSEVRLLDAALARWAEILERDLPGCPRGLARLPGGGAAGGLGAAVLAIGGKIISGVHLVLGETGLKEEIARSGLVITGEGSFDPQSLRGKVIAGVAGAAQDNGVPCVVLAGRVTTGRREQGAAGVTEAHSLVDHFGSVERAMELPAEGLMELAQRLARQYSR